MSLTIKETSKKMIIGKIQPEKNDMMERQKKQKRKKRKRMTIFGKE